MRRFWLPAVVPSALVLSVWSGAAQAAPFSFNPVSFAGFANQTFKQDGRPLFVKNLGNCMREGNNKAGYRCFSGELLEDVPAKQGRNFCKLDAIWYVPFSKTVQYRTARCQFRNDRQRMLEQGQQLLRQGLEKLENYSK